MARALVQARRGINTVTPNPAVGCVIVRDGTVVGEGWHARAGEPHAEVHALQAAGDAARGATVYVTLEPCAHTGRTGPCAEALIKAGVLRVVASMQDPNPEVAGSGLQKLRDAGITVEQGLLAGDAEKLNRGFCKRMRSGTPFVTLKLAASLDGRTAAVDGSSQWITGEAARGDVQRLRARSCAIVTGIGTVLGDDARLTVRLPDTNRQPLRAVLDRQLRTPAAANIVGDDGRCHLFHVVDDDERVRVLQDAGASLHLGCEPAAVLDTLAELGCNEVLIEAGATLAGTFIEANLVDELWLYQSPDLLGAGPALAELPALRSISDRRQWTIIDQRRIGRDTRMILRSA